MNRLWGFLAGAVALLLATAAVAQPYRSAANTAVQVNAVVIMCLDSSGRAVPATAAGVCLGAGGGGSGAEVGLTGAAVPTSAAFMGMSVGGNLTGLTGTGGSLNVNVTGGAATGSTFGASFPATGTAVGFSDGTNLVAGRATSAAIADNTTPPTSSLAIVNSFPMIWDGTNWDRLISGAGAVTGGTIRTTQASDSPLVAAIGAQADAACGTATGTCSQIALQKYLNSAAGQGVGATGSAVPSQGVYFGLNVAGNLRGPTGVNPTGSVYAQQQDLASIGGTAFATGVPIKGGYGAAQLTNTPLSFGSSGDNTIITRVTGTIKVYGIAISCASSLTTVLIKNGAGATIGTYKGVSSLVLGTPAGGMGTEPLWTTTSTNNFIINLSSAVDCGGNVYSLDN